MSGGHLCVAEAPTEAQAETLLLPQKGESKMSEKIYTKNAPEAIGPYSQAVKVGNLVFTSGQIAINPATGNVEADTIEAQTEQVCKNLCEVLKSAGTDIEKAVKKVLADGLRTGDIYEAGTKRVGTKEMGKLIAERI